MTAMLIDLPREAILRPGWWASSPPVPRRERPVRPESPRLAPPEGLWVGALGALRNTGEHDLGYDQWRDVVFAIHHETGGSDAGLQLAHEFSARSSKYDPAFLDERVWPYIRDREGGGSVGGGTVMSLAARLHGWTAPLDDSAFEVVETVGARRGGGGGEAEGGGAAIVVGDDGGDTDDLPAFDREKTGAIKPTVDNAVKAVRRADLCGMRVAYDEFRDEITVGAPGGDHGGWRSMTDADMVRLRIHLERLRFKAAPKELARDAAVLVAEENRYDSAQLWLAGIEPCWDGVHRCETFLVDFFGCEDTPYTRAVGLYIWTALAGRVIEPGCQADMAPVLEGDQGLRKTSAVAAMAPAPEFFVEVDFSKDDTDMARLLRGVLVAEINELRGLNTKDQESIKAFVSRRWEKWTPKYKEFATTFARRALLFGTTNRTDILADETGNRRWLPLHVERADVEGIVAARDQLWAEGAARFRGLVPGSVGGGGSGEPLRPSGVAWEAAERLAVPEHATYTVEDAWEGPIAAWLGEVDAFEPADEEGAGGADRQEAGAQPEACGTRIRGEGAFTVAELMSGALGLSAKDMGMAALKRVGAILKTLGYERANIRKDGQQTRVWRRATRATRTIPVVFE